MANFIMGIISLSVGVVILSSVFITSVKTSASTAYPCFNSTGGNTTCVMTGAEASLWGLLTIGGIAGLVYGTINLFGLA